MMPTSTPGLDADLLAIKPQAPKARAAGEAGQPFSHELKERMESRETQSDSALEERDGIDEEVATSESDELEGRDGEELNAEEQPRREGKGEQDEAEERQETVSAGEEAEEEGGKMLPFSLAAPLPLETPAAAREAEGADAPFDSGSRVSALSPAERLKATPSVAVPKGEAAIEAPLEGEQGATLHEARVAAAREPKTTATLHATLKGAPLEAAMAARSEVPVEGDVTVLRAVTARAGESAAPVQELLNTGSTPLPGSAAASAAAPAPAVAASAPVQGGLGTTPSNLVQLPVQPPVQQPGWDRAMGERMVWMARNSVQEAQLQLNPRHLGPIEVRLTLNQDQAQVSFVAATPQAREALESSLPRLREMFADQGLNLGQADVHSRGQQQQQGEGRSGGGGRAFGFAEIGTEEGSTLIQHAPLAPGRLDFYA